MNIDNMRIALSVIEEATKKVQSGYTCDVKSYLREQVAIHDRKEEERIREENTISIKDATIIEVFKDYVQEILHERLMDKTPHGEYGEDEEGEFYWNDKVWHCVYSPNWNRYDKQYYYIDNYGNNLKVEEVK